MDLETIVNISDACWDNIKRNIVEKRKNESMGDLIGKKSQNINYLTNSYPWVSAKTTPNSVWYGNKTARQRVIKLDRAEKSSNKPSIIGHYHTHVYEKENQREYMSTIKNEDLCLLREVMKKYHLEESIQIIATVKIRDNSKRKSGEKTKEYKKKLRITFGYDHTSYDVIIASYILTQERWEHVQIKRTKE